MKFCTVISEFNPFHNGHKYLLDKARKISGADKVICLMSGPFTQRGEMAMMDKYTRATHAILGGADIVAELPVQFAVSPAEIFAQGAIQTLSAIPGVSTIAFGCESGSKMDFEASAMIQMNESDQFKEVLQEGLARGQSYVVSYQNAFVSCGGTLDMVSNPNNILGIEYTKAIRSMHLPVDIIPVSRVGNAAHNDTKPHEIYSSATAIRTNPDGELARSSVPPYVAECLKDDYEYQNNFKHYLMDNLYDTAPQDLKECMGCTEGLENRMKDKQHMPYDDFIAEVTTKRYPSARIRRILLANALGISEMEVQHLVMVPHKITLLAVEKSTAPDLFRDASFMARVQDHDVREVQAQNLWLQCHNQPALWRNPAIVERP
ncbi:MAG: nucleotidyltransferase family protein [Clostridia bacterium]|nr:nucleotidyltransferase family protein [Clostridia bacterium]